MVVAETRDHIRENRFFRNHFRENEIDPFALKVMALNGQATRIEEMKAANNRVAD